MDVFKQIDYIPNLRSHEIATLLINNYCHIHSFETKDWKRSFLQTCDVSQKRVLGGHIDRSLPRGWNFVRPEEKHSKWVCVTTQLIEQKALRGHHKLAVNSCQEYVGLMISTYQ